MKAPFQGLLKTTFMMLIFHIEPLLAQDAKNKDHTFETFTKHEYPQFKSDEHPSDCKEVTVKKGKKSYEGCFIDKKPIYIRMLDSGTPWAVLLFRSGKAVVYEGIESTSVSLLKNSELYAVYDSTEKTVRKDFSNADGKDLRKQVKLEVAGALAAFKLK